jgi:DNA-directed RNA polymerase subunit RPC12/RpoP
MDTDPFSRRYETCSRCGGRVGTMQESASSGAQRTYQTCRKCNSKILTAQVNVIRVPMTPGTKKA